MSEKPPASIYFGGENQWARSLMCSVITAQPQPPLSAFISVSASRSILILSSSINPHPVRSPQRFSQPPDHFSHAQSRSLSPFFFFFVAPIDSLAEVSRCQWQWHFHHQLVWVKPWTSRSQSKKYQTQIPESDFLLHPGNERLVQFVDKLQPETNGLSFMHLTLSSSDLWPLNPPWRVSVLKISLCSR